MNLIIITVMFGAAMGCLAIACFIAFNHFAQRHEERMGSTFIPKAYSTFEINPGALLSLIGAGRQAHHSLDTVTMRPTIGIKGFGFLMVGLMIMIMTGENGEIYRADLFSVLIASGCTLYFVVFLFMYEVRYDGETLTSPGVFMLPKTHSWDEFISIRQTDQVTYTLQFETGKVKVRKFLVGMPTFLTFVTDIRQMNKRR